MSSVTDVMRSMEREDNEDDSDVLLLLESVSSRSPFDSNTQPVLHPISKTLIPHCHCECLTPEPIPIQRPCHITHVPVTILKLNIELYWNYNKPICSPE